jgi:c-di-GMP-binding flagellar brake protein YcgR
MVMNDLKKFLKINQLVNIELISKTGESTRYPSRVENLTENSLILVAPMKNRQPLILAPGTSLNIWLWNDKAIYVFRTYLLENMEASIAKIIVAYPKLIERVQKREFVRVGLVLEVLLSYFNSLGEEEVIRCQSRDISGGGMMLVLKNYVPLKKGCKIKAQFMLDKTLIKTPAIIVWNDWELDSEGIERNLIGIKFTNIAETDRKIIIKSVYKRQIELKRKGLF